ncbi:Gfo/Idh/MocA family oxidoreductase [Sphingobacterium sp. DN00404]|uniref:Gfo/Idh/MocA family oxidoreductase n=1 Tax=Sphingobacterium micropteri TaxID=2763501 RepID=A0ABR7YUF2_9SPHI|nr:Gfo/Idh/MocA family oxidoreductase [Sphingobacterium micropteri]MBD1434910.1 Gfo/Idh/MocA family oxidoreductase [Sphingobacterium micropteri]
MKPILLNIFLILISHLVFAEVPLRLAVAGLSHGHVDWIFNREDKKDVVVIGIYETNPELIDHYAKRYQLDKALFFTDLEEMLDELKPAAVSAFGAINEHISVVRACAPRKIHVMVEKPLATTVADAKEIKELAERYKIHVLTNFETSWYESNQQIKEMLAKGQLGEIRKVMVNDGHQGPKEIGVSKEFLEILTDPAKNGAGALVDFGCYGANLMTWLMNGERPLSVTAAVHQNKPNIYKEVDDEATIILQYPNAQCLIQASWNWPFSRKDMEVYGTKGYAIAPDATTLQHRLSGNNKEEKTQLPARAAPFDDPFSVLAAVVNGSLALEKLDLYELTINCIVVEILDAAMQSAKQKRTIFLK